jgi:hemerythrin-like metal-binding protein
MSLMHWTPAMSVGIPELDADHRVLIKVINELAENANNPDRAKVLRQCLYALLRYAEFHFTREEKVLEACDFPAIDHHKDEHRVFTDHMRELARRFDDEEVLAADIVNDQLLGYLKDWLNHHILIEDMAYRRYAEPHSEARAAAKAFRASEIWWGP